MSKPSRPMHGRIWLANAIVVATFLLLSMFFDAAMQMIMVLVGAGMLVILGAMYQDLYDKYVCQVEDVIEK